MQKYSKILIITLIQAILYTLLWYSEIIFLGNFRLDSKLLTIFAYTYLITLILNFVVVLYFNRCKYSLKYLLIPLISITALILFINTTHFHGDYYAHIFTAICIIIANCGFVYLSSKKLSDYISVPIVILVATAATIIFNGIKNHYLNILIASEGEIYSIWYKDLEILFVLYFLISVILNISAWNKAYKVYIPIIIFAVSIFIIQIFIFKRHPDLQVGASVATTSITLFQYLIIYGVRRFIDTIKKAKSAVDALPETNYKTNKKYSKILITTLIQTFLYLSIFFVARIDIYDNILTIDSIIVIFVIFVIVYLIMSILNTLFSLYFNNINQKLKKLTLFLYVFTIAVILFLYTTLVWFYFLPYLFIVYVTITNFVAVYLSTKKLFDYISIPLLVLTTTIFSFIFYIITTYSHDIVFYIFGLEKIDPEFWQNMDFQIFIYYILFLIVNILIWYKKKLLYTPVIILTLFIVGPKLNLVYKEPLLFTFVLMGAIFYVWGQYFTMIALRKITDKWENKRAMRNLNETTDKT